MSKIALAVFLIFTSINIHAASSKEVVSKVFKLYELGQYEKVIKVLDKLEKRVNKTSKKGKEIRGLISYWKGMSNARLNEFDAAETHFKDAIRLKYNAKDIYYEYGQVLYVSEKYKRARIAFKKSVKNKYKVGVSLYYIGFISQELKEYKKSVSFYNLIEKLPKEERDQVAQAARMQIGDVYLMQVERQPDVYNAVKDYVIPQYKKALEYNEESSLASTIKDKIEKLQRKYELVLFRMRNGRTTARPPYYMRINGLYGTNDNVTLLSEDSKASAEADTYSSPYYQLGAFGRYSIYPNSAFSYAPELSVGYTKYMADTAEIKPFNTYFYTTALKTNYEFLYNNAPATVFTDFDYTYNADDADADDTFAQSSTVTGVSLSTQLEFWKSNATTLRLRWSQTDAVVDTNDLSNITLGWEQIVLLKSITLFFFNQYVMNTNAQDDTQNTNVLTSRVDTIWGMIPVITPTLYFSYTNTDFVNNSDNDPNALLTYGINLSKKIGKKYYLTFDYSQGSQTGTTEYQQQIMTLNLDYIY